MTGNVQEYLDIPYLPSLVRNKQHELDVYVPISDDLTQKRTKLPGLICFVHGGAWRSEDKSMHAQLARGLAIATGFAVGVPNYRLTSTASPLQHPAHAEDVLSALSFLLSWHGPLPPGAHTPELPYDRTKMFLVGHSCGAHIIASIVLDSSKVTPSLTPHTTSAAAPHTPHLLSTIQGIVVSEGIYDLDLLISSFPDYDEMFIAPAFGPRESYKPFSVTEYPLRHDDKHIQWLIIQSKGDTLIDVKQAEAMYKHLQQLYSNVGGDTSTTQVEATVDHAKAVSKDWDSLDGDHDDVPVGDQYVKIIQEFVASVLS